MRRFFSGVSILVAFFLLAAPTAVERGRQIVLNGKPLVSSYIVDGQCYVALEDLAKAVGMSTTLEPAFKLEGRKLVAFSWGAVGPETVGSKHKLEASPTIKVESSVTIKGESTVAHKAPEAVGIKGELKAIKLQPGQTLRIARGGEVSAQVDYFDKKAYVPLADVVKALGASYELPLESLKGGDPIRLNVRSRCQHCILIGL